MHSTLNAAFHGALLALILGVGACSRQPNSYPPPAQFVMPSGPEPRVPPQTGERLMLFMSDEDVGSYMTDDIKEGVEGYVYRPVGLHPKFRLNIERVSRFDFYIRFFNHEAALRERGPVSLVIGIRGRYFKTPGFSFGGSQKYRWIIPEGWITEPGPLELSLDIDP